MYTLSTIESNFLQVVGWRRPSDLLDNPILDTMYTSLSGVFFQDAHPLITYENLRAVAPVDETVYTPYSSTNPYLTGAKVTHAGVRYQALSNNTGQIPSSNSTVWQVYNPFANWLQAKTRTAVRNAFQKYVNVKEVDGTAKNLLLDRPLFSGAGNYIDQINKSNRFVGIKIAPINSQGLRLVLRRVGLQFANQTASFSLPIRVYHSSNFNTPFQTVNITRTNTNSITWHDVNISLPFMADQIDAGGYWLIGYDEASLPTAVKAVNRGIELDKPPCSTCLNSDSYNYYSRAKYFTAYAISGLSNLEYHKQQNFGLNLMFSIDCDLTNFYVSRRLDFTRLISLSAAELFLDELAVNAMHRINRANQNITYEQIQYELGGSDGKSNIIKDINLAIRALDFDMSEVCEACLPFRDRRNFLTTWV